MRLMYVHAYQSFVWNHAASERIRLYGTKNVVVGDIVLLDGELNEVDEDEPVNTMVMSYLPTQVLYISVLTFLQF
jgi:tRNA pseudouridine13 synthase